MWNINLEPTIGKKMVGSSRGSVTNVDTSGAVVLLPITKLAEISQMAIKHLGGGSFSIEIYDNSILSNNVFKAESDALGDRWDLSKMQFRYENMDTPKQNFIYIKVIPTSGSGHEFLVSFFYDKL
ncbi:MAG: hypothetical protein WC511_02980 [Candidatus Pacearchaeota archaeon]